MCLCLCVFVCVPLHYSTSSQAVLDTVAGQPPEMKVSRTGRLGLEGGREREKDTIIAISLSKLEVMLLCPFILNWPWPFDFGRH